MMIYVLEAQKTENMFLYLFGANTYNETFCGANYCADATCLLNSSRKTYVGFFLEVPSEVFDCAGNPTKLKIQDFWKTSFRPCPLF